MPEKNAAISRITNHEVVIQRFGYWPSFHDAEVLKVTFEAHPGYRATVTFLIETSEFTKELDLRGYYKPFNKCQIELNFTGIREMHFEDFNHQNVIFELEFEEVGEFIECTFDSSTGLSASIKAEEVCILSLAPIDPTPEKPLIDIQSADMSVAANIVSASQDLVRNFEWSEWVYIGLDNEQVQDYQAKKVAEQVQTFFTDEAVYLIDEDNSRLVKLSDLVNQISILTRNEDILVCSMNFTKAMRFNRIGVMSHGQKRS